MPFSISSVSPSEILGNVGQEIEITGTFEDGHRYYAYIGDTGTIYDPRCLSGIPGEANVLRPRLGTATTPPTLLRAFTPALEPSGASYDLVVMDIDTLEAHVLSGVLDVSGRQFFTTVYAVRKILPPHWKAGPRKIEEEQPT